MTDLILIDPDLWATTRAGARAGRGFRYQDALCAALAVQAWTGDALWKAVVPEGLEDATLHGAKMEIRAQIKSRHNPQNLFSLSEVAEHVATMTLKFEGVAEANVRLALILETEVKGLQGGGFSDPIGRSGQSLDDLTRALQKAYGDRTLDAPLLFDRLHLIIAPDPLGTLPEILKSRSGLDPAAGRLVGQLLREAAGRAADDNFSNRPESPATLGATEVQAFIDNVQRIIDPLGRLKLSDGLCEAANFHEPLNTPDFYSGVNVMPGHVGAGLVFDRPVETADILEALEVSRRCLVAGPSGAGKSALTWLAAHHTRHAVRWYRVRRLSEVDVPRLVQLARILDVNPMRPVGFVVDDVGRSGAAGWDALVTEVEAIPGLLLIGSVREEDIFLLGTASTTAVVRPHLDEALAQRLWLALSTAVDVAFSHWVEPFEESRGLLLEYTHLLTKGRRLEQTLAEQVRRRLAEERTDELELMRSIVFPGRHGAAVDGRAVQAGLGWDDFRMSRALARLIEEHAVRELPDGRLGGLHEIRSAYLDDALQACIATPLADKVARAAAAVVAANLPAFVTRVLRAHPETQAALIVALASRIAAGELADLTAALHGLGLATADIVAAQWLEISRRFEVEDRFSSFLFTLTNSDPIEGDLPLFVKLRETGAAFSDVQVGDLRIALLDALNDLGNLNMREFELEDVHRLQAALLPLRGCPVAPEFDLTINQDLSQVPVIPLLEFVRTTDEVSPPQAARLVELAGGSEALLSRLRDELPWITSPGLMDLEDEENGDTEVAVEGYVRIISETVQTDLHGDVVRLCELMLAAAPEARRAISDALLPTGSPMMLGDRSLNSKRIPRGNLPGPARVAWTRVQARAIDRLVGAPQETGRTASLASLIEELARRLDEAATFYLRMEQPGTRWRLLLDIGAMLRGFVPPPRVNEAMSDTLDAGSYSSSDKIHAFAADLQRLATELADGDDKDVKVRAMRVAGLVQTARTLADPTLWRMISSPPTQAMSELYDRLQNIRAVCGHVANDPRRRERWATHFSKTSRRHSPLPAAAAQSRTQADADLALRRMSYEQAFADAGLQVQVYSRVPEKDEGYAWPHVYFAGLVTADSIQDWLEAMPRFVEVCEGLADAPRMTSAPLVGDQIPPIAMVRIGDTLFPDLAFTEEWAEHIPYPIIETPLLDKVTTTLNDISALSAMISDKGIDLNPAETAHAEAHLERINGAVAWFNDAILDNPSVAVAYTGQLVQMCFERIQAELEDGFEGETLASEFTRMLFNDMTDLTAQIAGLRVGLMEHALGLETWSDLSAPLGDETPDI